MHLKLFIFVALVALGTAAKQARKNSNYEEIGNKRWKKDLGYTKKSQLNDKNYNSQKNVPYPRKDGRKPKAQILEPVAQISPEYSEQESESLGNRVDIDYMSTQIPEDNLNEDSFGETDPPCQMPSGSYPKKQNFDDTICNKRVQVWDNEEEWNLMQKLKDFRNMFTPEGRHSVPTKSQIGSSDQTEKRAAEEIESQRDSEKLMDAEECTGKSHSKLPTSRKTQTTTERYLNPKNGMKLSSDIMTKLYPEQKNVKSLDRQLKVQEERSMEISALSAKLAMIEEKLAEISEYLLDREVDELFSNSVDMLVRPVMRE